MKRPPRATTPELRRAAEKQLSERLKTGGEVLPSADEAARLVHELRVHQIELEMQNHELESARADLEVALSRYADLYDFAPVGYFSLDREGTIREVNLTGAQLLGVERASLRGRRLAELIGYDEAATLDYLLGDAASGTSKACVELTPTGHPRDATTRTLELTVTARGEEYRAVAIDVTERKRAEALLLSSQKMEAIGRLAGGVAHDFNNLLHVILSRADFALESLDQSTPLHHELEEIRTAGRSAATLTRQLLAFGRKQALRLEILDLNDVVRRVAPMLARILEERIELVSKLDPEILAIEGDASHLDELVMSLAVHARDAMPQGGQLSLTTANVALAGERAQELGLPAGAYAILSVIDTGMGMDAETVSRLFEPFFSVKKRDRDTPLGLSAVHGLVKQLGGDIFVQSEPGRGTVVQSYFRRATSGLPRPAPRDRGAPAAHETILVVEDEEAVARVTTLILQRVGYRVLTAASGEAALVVTREHDGPIHLLLTDVLMPGMSGVALARAVKETRPETAVLLMSGYSDELVDRMLGDHASLPLINKPFTTQSLRTRVREVLDARPPSIPAPATE